MTAGHFRSTVWDPALIIAQIVTMLAIYYVSLGAWIFVVDYIARTTPSLEHIFSFDVGLPMIVVSAYYVF